MITITMPEWFTWLLAGLISLQIFLILLSLYLRWLGQRLRRRALRYSYNVKKKGL